MSVQGYTVFSIPVGVVYRPNEAKVKNLKTKDYLGKARLVAASAGANTSVGFQGSDRKEALAAEQVSKDDRLPENISYAATNLVQRNLSSRGGREQSAPPNLNRNMFPPTPPPESDKPPRSSAPAMTGRAASVRNPPSRPLGQQQQNGEFQMNDPRMDRPGMFGRSNTVDIHRTSSPHRAANADRAETWTPPRLQRPRIGTTRTASEPRVPSAQRRQYSDRRPALFRETTPQRPFEPIQEDNVYEDVYDMYQTRSSGGSGRSGSRQPAFNGEPRFSNGSDDTVAETYEEDDFGKVEGPYFDMIGGQHSQARRPNLPVRSSSRRRPDIRNVRVKVHAHDDTRYMMFGSAVEYCDFEGKIREKFGFKSKLKIRMQDEGDMITMGDQDDLDMLLATAKEAARKENSEMAKMEVSSLPTLEQASVLTSMNRCGYKRSDLRGTLSLLLLQSSMTRRLRVRLGVRGSPF